MIAAAPEQFAVEAPLSRPYPGERRDAIPLAAHNLDPSERTSKFHQSNLLTKLGAESRFDLLRLFL